MIGLSIRENYDVIGFLFLSVLRYLVFLVYLIEVFKVFNLS